MRTAALVLEGLDAVDAVDAVSEAWWTRMNISLTATPTSVVASVGANEVVLVDIGIVPVIISRLPVIVTPPIVHVPDTGFRSRPGKRRWQPAVGVKVELGSTE